MTNIETRGRKPLRAGEQTARVTVRLAASDYGWLMHRAASSGETVSDALRDLIADRRRDVKTAAHPT